MKLKKLINMQLDPRLESDSLFIKDLKLCQLRLIPDGENPWFILVPRLDNIIDWSDLSREQQHELTDEIDYVCKLLKEFENPDKLNIGSLGNMVPQLHIHIIARYKTDRAWPGSIWGSKSVKEFNEDLVKTWCDRIL